MLQRYVYLCHSQIIISSKPYVSKTLLTRWTEEMQIHCPSCSMGDAERRPSKWDNSCLYPPLSKNQNCFWLVNLFAWLHSRSPGNQSRVNRGHSKFPKVRRVAMKSATAVGGGGGGRGRGILPKERLKIYTFQHAIRVILRLLYR